MIRTSKKLTITLIITIMAVGLMAANPGYTTADVREILPATDRRTDTLDYLNDLGIVGAIAAYGAATEDMVIDIDADIAITSTLYVPANANGKTLTIKSANAESPATLTRDFAGYDNLFTVSGGATLILENIVIDGSKETYSYGMPPLVYVAGGEFIMKDGAALTNNGDGGVYVSRGTFTMLGGRISHNAASYGGGVYISGGEFIMSGGEISHNAAEWGFGGGVYIDYTIDDFGGGDYIAGGTFTMLGGKIINNIAEWSYGDGYGGGVFASDKFTMLGGEISGNIAGFGGGVFVESAYGEFTVGGAAVVSGNINNNAYLSYGEYTGIQAYITLSTETPPAPGMNIGVQTEMQDGVIVEYGAWPGVEVYFFADEPDRRIIHESGMLRITALPEEEPVTLVGATPSASVRVLNGNKNDLTITVTEIYSDGSINKITLTISINSNAAGSYQVGSYIVYVDTKGNDQIRQCYIVK